MNDIINTVPHSKVYTYADDTTLIVYAESTIKLQQLAQSELANLISYFHSNNLVPNPTKTQYTIFYPTPTPLHDDITLHIGDVTLKHTTTARLLGVTMQQNLKHHETIKNIVRKLQTTIQMFRHVNKLVDRRIMVRLYYAYAYPHLIGNITVWGHENDNKDYLQPLIKTHKKIVRLTCNVPPLTHTKPLMAQLHILKLTNVYILRAALEMHPFIYPQGQRNRPEHNHHYIWTTQIHDYPTRYSRQQRHYITNNNRRAVVDMTDTTRRNSKIWNSIPLEIQHMRNKQQFKQRLTDYLLKQQSDEANKTND